MEVFVDFGAFELMAASGVMWLSTTIYRRRLSRWAALALSIVAPGALLVQASSEGTRWIAALALAASLLNVSVIVRLMRDGVLDKPESGRASAAAAAACTK